VLRVHVVAHPGSRREKVELLDQDVLGVWVQARPVEGQANAAIELALASALGLRPRQVRLVVGQIGRRKIVEIDGLTQEALRTRLLARALHQRSLRLDSDPD
jgi:uncharacterized protein YggU (UPF0235/DUF167 family)